MDYCESVLYRLINSVFIVICCNWYNSRRIKIEYLIYRLVYRFLLEQSKLPILLWLMKTYYFPMTNKNFTFSYDLGKLSIFLWPIKTFYYLWPIKTAIFLWTNRNIYLPMGYDQLKRSTSYIKRKLYIFLWPIELSILFCPIKNVPFTFSYD